MLQPNELQSNTYTHDRRLSIINQDAIMSHLEDQFLSEPLDDQQLLDDWEELRPLTPCNFQGKHYHHSFDF